MHFLGRIPYHDHLSLLRVPAVHVWMTVPFVLSWSMPEAMASGCVVVGSATPPVRDVIEDGRNGLLADFFDHNALADLGGDPLGRVGTLTAIRWTALSHFPLDRCVPRQIALREALAAGRQPDPD